MDKAQARILTLVLIAVLFIGQALYDFIKKNRSRSANRPRQSITKHKRPVQTRQQSYSQPKTHSNVRPRPTVSELAGLSELESNPSATQNQLNSIYKENESVEHEMDSAVPQHALESSEREDLRRAVIWSEILKRKF